MHLISGCFILEMPWMKVCACVCVGGGGMISSDSIIHSS